MDIIDKVRQRKRYEMKMKKNKLIFLTIFVIYILIVLKLTIFRVNVHYDERQLNLTLFIDLINIYRHVGIGEFLRLFLGNIGWFIPFGFLLPVLLKKESLFKTMIMGIMFSLIIEMLQFVFYKGVAELDDVILNALGTAFGYYIFKFYAGRFSPD